MLLWLTGIMGEFDTEQRFCRLPATALQLSIILIVCNRRTAGTKPFFCTEYAMFISALHDSSV